MTPAVETTQAAPRYRRPRWAAQTFRVCTAPTPLSKRRRSEGYVNVESIDISSESHFVAVVFCLPSRVTFKKGKTLVEECQGITLIKLEGVVNLPLVIPSICSCKANAQVSLRGPSCCEASDGNTEQQESQVVLLVDDREPLVGIGLASPDLHFWVDWAHSKSMQINCILTTVFLHVEVFVSQLFLVRSRTDKAQGAVDLFWWMGRCGTMAFQCLRLTKSKPIQLCCPN